MNERVKNSARNMVAATVFRVINLSFPFIVNTIIIQVLGVEYLGLNMLFASILQVLGITELGFGTALIFSMYEPVANKDTAKVSALLNLYRKVYMIIGGVILCSTIGSSFFRGLGVWVVSKKMFPVYRAEGEISKSEKKSLFARVVGLSINKIWPFAESCEKNSLRKNLISYMVNIIIARGIRLRNFSL